MTIEGIRNLKDFLLQYNRISESCFSQCVNTFGERDMTLQEANCAETCVKKFTQLNFKVMSVYVEVQPQIVEKRLQDMSNQQASVPQADTMVKEAVETSNNSKETALKA